MSQEQMGTQARFNSKLSGATRPAGYDSCSGGSSDGELVKTSEEVVQKPHS